MFLANLNFPERGYCRKSGMEGKSEREREKIESRGGNEKGK